MTIFETFKPPIGICPRWHWLESLEIPYSPSKEEKEDRILKLKGAIERYENWDYLSMKYYELLDKWRDELKPLQDENL